MITSDPKAMQDGIGTFKSTHSYIEHGMAQGYVPIINHQRTCYVWVWQDNMAQMQSVNTEKIEVRARLNPRLRRK